MVKAPGEVYEALSRSEGFMKGVLESLSEGVCVLNAEGTVVYFNNSAGELLGVDQTSLGKPFAEFLFSSSNANAEISSAPIEFTLSERQPSHILSENFYRPDGTKLLVEYICSPLYSAAEMAGAVITFQDISERLDTETAITAAKDSALEVARLRSAFLANMSHEIRTPLNGIAGITELLAATDLSDEQRQYLSVLRRSGEALLDIVNNVLDLSRVEAKRFELEIRPFEPIKLFSHLAELFGAHAQKKGVSLELEIDPAIPATLIGDDHKIRQILINLISNAIKFTDHGSIIVRAFGGRSEGGDFSLGVAVEDTGIGIDPGRLGSIFDPYVQADVATYRQYGGTGLGLAISQQFAEMMGGNLTVESDPGVGSKFTLTLDLGISGAQVFEESRLERSLAPNRKIEGDLRILVAEDNEINRFITISMLNQLGYSTISEAKNGLEVLDHLEKEPFDVILMDCLMPEMNGYDATREIRRISIPANKIRIIALTASNVEGEKEKCILAGMDDYLAKPFSKDQLRKILKKNIADAELKDSLDSDADMFQHPLTAILDKEKLKEFTEIESRGEKGFLQELVGMYLVHTEKTLHELKATHDDRDRMGSIGLAHSLKGSSLNIGFGELARIFSSMESEFEAGNWDNAEELLEQTNQTFLAAKERFQTLFGDRGIAR